MLYDDKILLLMSTYDFKVQDAVFVSIGFKVEQNGMRSTAYDDLFADLKILLDAANANTSAAACF